MRGKLLETQDLIAIGARAGLVPAGPWRWEADDESGSVWIRAGDVRLHVDGATRQAAAVARFVAYARSDIPALLGHIRALEDQIAALRQQLASDRQAANRDRELQHLLVSELRERSESRLRRFRLVVAALSGALSGIVVRILIQ